MPRANTYLQGLFLLIFMLSLSGINAQVAIGTESPDPSSILHLKTTTKGLLPPVMSTTDRLAIVLPADGLIVYDSTASRYFFYNQFSASWLKISIDPDDDTDTDTQNSLDGAYDEGGAGAGRQITASDGAVEISATGGNEALVINNTTEKGIDVQTTVGDAIFAKATTGDGVEIDMAGTGSGLVAKNATVDAGDLINSIYSGTSSSGQYALGGRAGYFRVSNPGNFKPALEARTAGTGHGILGVTGAFSGTSEGIPVSGIVGLSLSDETRVGVFGQSSKSRGVFGKSNEKTSWGSDPLAFISGVYGEGKVLDAGTPMETDIFFGTTGVASSGAGVVGVSRGQGHGVIGVTKGGVSGGSQAGIWGAVQDGSWPSHSSAFPFIDGTAAKGLVGILGQSKSTTAIWGESQTGIGVIGTTGPKMGTAQTGVFSKVGVLGMAADASAHAGVFQQSEASTLATLLINSNATAPAIQVRNMGNGIGLDIEQPNEMIAGVLNTKRGIFLNHFGTGIGEEIRLENPMNESVGLIVSTLGTGKVADFTILDEMTNMEPVAKFEHRGKGSAGEFVIVDGESINGSPAIRARTTGTGSAARLEVEFAASTEPALDVATTAGRMGFFSTSNTTSTLTGVKIESGARGHVLEVIGTNTSTTDSEIPIIAEGNNGTVAHFDQKSFAVPFGSEAVLISSTSPAAFHAGLRVTVPTSMDPLLHAAEFEGNVSVAGTLTAGVAIAAPVKTFKIDHPQDEENKYLFHASIESDEYVNIYNGRIITDEEGFAKVALPVWMTSLNEDFRYQLTVIGKSFAQAIIWEEIKGDNSFIIRSNEPNITISWQVTGRRKDTWALEHPLEVEVYKPEQKRGRPTDYPASPVYPKK